MFGSQRKKLSAASRLGSGGFSTCGSFGHLQVTTYTNLLRNAPALGPQTIQIYKLRLIKPYGTLSRWVSLNTGAF